METGTSRKKRFLGMRVPGITSGLQRQRRRPLESSAGFSVGPLVDWRETERLFLSDPQDEC